MHWSGKRGTEVIYGKAYDMPVCPECQNKGKSGWLAILGLIGTDTLVVVRGNPLKGDLRFSFKNLEYAKLFAKANGGRIKGDISK